MNVHIHAAIPSTPRLEDRQSEASDVPEPIETWTLEEIDGLPGQHWSEQEPAQ